MNGEHRQEVNIEENLLLNDTLKSKIIKKNKIGELSFLLWLI